MSLLKKNSLVPRLDHYREDQILEFTQFSNVSKTYLRLIKETSTPEIYQIRHSAWLECSLSNYFNNSSHESRSSYWSETMDLIIKKCFHSVYDQEDKVLILGLGKLGSGVLNLSSDIDIIIVCENLPSEDLIKKTRHFLKLLNEKTEYGFLTRVDLNLKPNSVPGPLIPMNQLIAYLWSSTELWERLVYTRARKICGHLKDEVDLFENLKKFCFRKYIRYDLVAELSSLIKKILNNNDEPYNIKLCPGGIRSVELLISTIQLLYGGRLVELQNSHTYGIIESLSLLQIFNKKQIQTLKENYEILRNLEDSKQAELDQQIQTVNINDDLRHRLLENCQFIEGFLNHIDTSQKKDSDDYFKEFLNQHSSIKHLENFFTFLNKHPSYFNLFKAHPAVFKNLFLVLKFSPWATQQILLRPDLLDLFLIKKTIVNENIDSEDFLIQLADYKSLTTITAIGDFLQNFDLKVLNQRITDCADFCAKKIVTHVFKNSQIEVLKLGKWASSELGISSDLDFVFISEEESVNFKELRKFTNYLSHHSFFGPLYNIDLRLRPSGQAGPLVTTKKSFLDFAENQAELWQKQSYLRNLGLFCKTKFDYKIKLPLTNDLAEIRLKLLSKTTENKISFKNSFGGLVDIEFLVQSLFLSIEKFPKNNSVPDLLDELLETKTLSLNDIASLKTNYQKLRLLEQTTEILFKSNVLTKDNYPLMASTGLTQKIEILCFEDISILLRSNEQIVLKNHPFL